MASAVVFWHYQRRLSTGGTNQNEGQKTNMEVKTQRTRRLESESSVTGYQNEETERRDSATSAGDASDDENSPNETGKSKKRRFSLDFLFNRRKSQDKGGKKLKTKRSHSTAAESPTDTFAENSFRAYRFPGAEFALAM